MTFTFNDNGVYHVISKPILKWAGGKTQLLDSIFPHIPLSYKRYIEPFFGGGALFFALAPSNSIVSDSNPELINMYQQVARFPEKVISLLKEMPNEKGFFYDIRKLNWHDLAPDFAAARTIFLNRTCFNGLYRVNKKGEFNVPFGNYKKPVICDEETIRKASYYLRDAHILCGDYLEVLKQAQKGDFIFLDPPYIPISQYSDFKRYTKEQFSEEDHIRLKNECDRLVSVGCHILLTNSNHPLVKELYSSYSIDVVQTKRYISCKGATRKGEDVIVYKSPKQSFMIRSPEEQTNLYPATRYMGSKAKLLKDIWNVAKQFKFESALDLFSGSGVVGYMFKAHGKQVITNDYMTMSFNMAKAMIENDSTLLTRKKVNQLLKIPSSYSHFVYDKYRGLYFSDEENDLIDIIRYNIKELDNQFERAIATAALTRACIKKRPRGIFTYIGNRYDDGRKDLQLSLQEQFIDAVAIINRAIFSNGTKCQAVCTDSLLLVPDIKPDLVYIDPPYYSPLSDNEYVRRYHFVEGLARDWKGVEIQEHTKTKKFKSYPTPFTTRLGAIRAFDSLISRFRDSTIIVSYSSNGEPSLSEIVSLLKQYKPLVEVVPIDYRYSFGNQGNKVTHKNQVQEYLFVAYNQGALK